MSHTWETLRGHGFLPASHLVATDNNLQEKMQRLKIFEAGEKMKKIETSSLKWENNNLQIHAQEDMKKLQKSWLFLYRFEDALPTKPK